MLIEGGGRMEQPGTARAWPAIAGSLAIRCLALAGLLLPIVGFGAFGAPARGSTSAAPTSTGVLEGTHVLGWGFADPDAIASEDGDVFIANLQSNSITEFRASSGAAIRSIPGLRFGINSPAAIAVIGRALFVVNSASNSVTELSTSTGTPVRHITGSKYRFNSPDCIAVVGQDVFVAGLGNTVTEFNAANGALVRVIAGARYRFNDPDRKSTRLNSSH